MRKNILIMCISIVLLFSSLGVNAADDLYNEIDNYINTYENINVFSGTILVAKDGKIILNKAYGKANIELNVNNKKGSIYRIGSLTKQFTAVAILQLEEKGILSIEDKLTKHIPDYPRGHEITIKNLLNHTSGIFDYTRTRVFREKMGNKVKLDRVINMFKNKKLDFEPGSTYRYSNSNYILLGYIIEKNTNMSYEDYLEKNIFKPLKMKDSGFAYHDKIIKNRSTGYILNLDGSKVNIYHDDATFAHGAGALYSTTEDLYKWDRALYTEQLLTKESKKKIFKIYKGNYGLGFKIDLNEDHKRYYHHGATMGYTASINRFIDNDSTIIILSNINGIPVEKMTEDISKIIFKEEYYLPDLSFNITKKEFKKYEGDYKLESGRKLVITNKEEKYFAKIGNGPYFEIIASGENEFFNKILGEKIEFKLNKNKKVKSVYLYHVNNNTIKGDKI